MQICTQSAYVRMYIVDTHITCTFDCEDYLKLYPGVGGGGGIMGGSKEKVC